MTKLEELKAAWYEAEVARDAAFSALAALDDALGAANNVYKAYYKELKKQETAPREPVEGEGNPLV